MVNQFIPISMPSITQKEIDYVNDAVKSSWISSLGK
jgi:perosamine synthetase